MDVLKKQCLSAEGGYFFVRRENGVNYIDWLSEMPYSCNQPIEFGLNLLNISGDIGGEDVATCVLPLGDTDSETGQPLTVASINNGKKIVESEAVSVYGKITKAVTFSGVSDPRTLYQDGVEYLNSLQFDHLSIECDASELHFLNSNFEAFQVGQMIHCVSKPHLVDRDLPLTKMKEANPMEDMEQELNTIETASRGEEVRDAIVHALRSLNMSEEATKAAKTMTYTLTISGKTITLTNGDNVTQSVDVPVGRTYTMALNDHKLTLTDSEGTTQEVDLPNDVETALGKEY